MTDIKFGGENQENTTTSTDDFLSAIFDNSGKQFALSLDCTDPSMEYTDQSMEEDVSEVDELLNLNPSKKKGKSDRKKPKKPIKVTRNEGDNPLAAQYSEKDDGIFHGAIFESYPEFEEKFKAWMERHNQPFRKSSSDKFTNADGTWNKEIGYRSIVFHCPRYGDARVRGKYIILIVFQIKGIV